MKYQWELETISDYKKYYKSLLRGKNITVEKREELNAYIANIKEMELVIKNSHQPITEKKKVAYQDKKGWIPLSTYKEAQYIHPKVEKLMIGAMKSISKMRDTYNNIEVPKKNLTGEDVVNMAWDFAQWVPDKEYQREVKRYIDEKRHLIQFAKSIDKEELGTLYPFYQPEYKPYLLINRLNTIEDFSTLNHELAHSVFYRNDNPNNRTSNHFYLTELEGSFFDFLSLEYLKGKEEQPILIELEYGRTIGRLNNLMDFYLTDSAIKLYNKKGKVSLEPIHRRIMQDELNLNLNEGILMDSLQESPLDNAKYALSYLTSLDLENIYLFDPEYAFYLMKKIRNNKTENIFGNLRENGITFLNDGYENFKKKVKTLNTNC